MQYFYHNTIKKYTVAVSHLINDIWIQKKDKDGNIAKEIKVPITYYGKTKFYDYLNSIHSDIHTNNMIPGTISASMESLVPRIGFNDDAPVYDPMRKKNNTLYYISEDESLEIGESVPYNIPWNLSIITRDKNDMNQIVEQLLTIFTPYVSIDVIEIPELGITSKIAIQLDGVIYENDIEHSGEDGNRNLTTTINLTLKGHFYPRIKDTALIYHIQTNLLNKDTAELIATLDHEYNQLTEIVTSTITEY